MKSSATHTTPATPVAPVTPTTSATRATLDWSRYEVIDEQEAICVMCGSGESSETNVILFCDGPCRLAFHQGMLSMCVAGLLVVEN